MRAESKHENAHLSSYLSANFPFIIGPTAGGKTSLAVELALLAGKGEIVTSDSIQIYKGLDIGSAKPTLEERRGVTHHLIDIVEPIERFTVHDWLAAAERTIVEVRARGNLPIVVGGTHLYAKAFLEGMFEGPEGDEAYRAQLRGRGLTALREELERVDPDAARKINANDERRTIRALEVYHLTGKPITAHQQQWDREDHRRQDVLLVGLDWPSELINPRINARVKQMMDQGLVEETRRLLEAGRFGIQAREALGYKQLIAHFEHVGGMAARPGFETLENAIEQIKIETRRFAKNQRTWLKRLRSFPNAIWIDAAIEPPETWARKIMERLGG